LEDAQQPEDTLDPAVVQILLAVELVDALVDTRRLVELRVDIQILKVDTVQWQVDTAGCTHSYSFWLQI